MQKILFPLLAIALFTPTALTQEVTFRAKVEDGENLCYYCPGFGFTIHGTKTTLSSSVYNLTPYISTHIRGVGQWNGSTTAPNIDITFLAPVAESFSIGGGGDLGKELDFTANGLPGDIAVVAGSVGNLGGAGFTPLAGTGVVFLGLNNLIVLGSGVTDGQGEFTREVFIPNLPAFQGLQVFGQGVIFPSGDQPYTTNVDFKVLGT
jgi:hypothetical protein